MITVIVNCVSFGITSTDDDQIQHGTLQTKVANCQLVSVKKSDFCAIMHRVRIPLLSSFYLTTVVDCI